MITAYAIIASLLLGGFVRHNFSEMKSQYRWYRLAKKERRRVAREQEKAEKTPIDPITARLAE